MHQPTRDTDTCAAADRRRGTRAQLLLAGALLATLATGPAEATLVTMTGGGTLDSVDASVSGTFSLGDAFSFSFTYDDASPDNLPANTTFGNYNANPLTSLSATIGGYSVSWTAGVSTINIPVNSVMDVIIGPGGFTGAAVAGLTPQFGNIALFDGDGAGGVLATDALPSAPFTDISAFSSSSNFRLRFGPTFNINEIQGQISFLGAPPTAGVPEPTTLALFGAALFGVVSVRRRRR